MAVTRPLVEACFARPTTRTPVWMMRQAGRYLPEYRAVRETHSLLEICAIPEVTAEVTLQPLRRFDFDAAIIFADILLPLVPMGIEVEFVEGVGPVIGNPIASARDIEALRPLDPEASLGATLEALRLVRGELDDEVSLIGFAGAPFTLASYLIEGGPSRNFQRTKAFLYHDPAAFARLLGTLADAMTGYLRAQLTAGADVVQLFDSWVGALAPEDYRVHVLPHSRRILQAVRETGSPAIHFGVGASTLLELLAEAGGDVVGLDWRIPLDEGWTRLSAGRSVAVQGNLDPVVLFGPPEEITGRTQDILRLADGRAGHIFNLGHGVLPGTPIAGVERMVEAVREFEQAT